MQNSSPLRVVLCVVFFSAVAVETLDDGSAEVPSAPEVVASSELSTTTHRPMVHGEGQPSIAGSGLWVFFGIIVTAGLVLDQMCSKKFAGRMVRGAIYSSAA